jgi:leucyl aminopeptidase (aminopeptidase T)
MNEQPPEDMLWGVGVSSAASMQLRMDMADSGARADLARQLQTLAQGMVENFQRESGSIDAPAAMGFQQSVTRQLAQATLTGAVRDVSWTTPDNKTLWVRLKMSKADAAKLAGSEVGKVVENEASRYAEFKAMDALKMMDAELDKYTSKPEPVIK